MSNTHTCHWPECKQRVPAKMWGCKQHWYMLPADLRRLVWVAYEPGQETTKTPSRYYVSVARRVREWIRDNHPTQQGLL